MPNRVAGYSYAITKLLLRPLIYGCHRAGSTPLPLRVTTRGKRDHIGTQQIRALFDEEAGSGQNAALLILVESEIAVGDEVELRQRHDNDYNEPVIQANHREGECSQQNSGHNHYIYI